MVGRDKDTIWAHSNANPQQRLKTQLNVKWCPERTDSLVESLKSVPSELRFYGRSVYSFIIVAVIGPRKPRMDLPFAVRWFPRQYRRSGEEEHILFNESQRGDGSVRLIRPNSQPAVGAEGVFQGELYLPFVTLF